MKHKVLKVFFGIIILMISCQKQESVSSIDTDSNIENAYNKQKTASLNKEINYIPNWSEKQEYQGEIYVPLQADKKIYPIIDGHKLKSINDDLWLRGVYKKDNWEFTIMKVFPENPNNKFKAGIVVYEDFLSGNLSYREYADSKFLIKKKVLKQSNALKKISSNPMDEQPPCKQVYVQVCAGEGAEMACDTRLMVICENDGETPNPPNPSNPSNPPPLGGIGSPPLSGAEMAALASLEQQYKSRMSAEELNIYNNMSLKNKFAYLTNAKQAEETARSRYPASTLYNGKGDAFRHAYFHALNSITIGSELSTKLGDAHELGSDLTEKAMDLYNNAFGRSYLQNAGPGESPSDFVSRSLSNGSLRYLSPLGINNTVIPNVTKLIPTNQ